MWTLASLGDERAHAAGRVRDSGQPRIRSVDLGVGVRRDQPCELGARSRSVDRHGYGAQEPHPGGSEVPARHALLQSRAHVRQRAAQAARDRPASTASTSRRQHHGRVRTDRTGSQGRDRGAAVRQGVHRRRRRPSVEGRREDAAREDVSCSAPAPACGTPRGLGERARDVQAGPVRRRLLARRRLQVVVRLHRRHGERTQLEVIFDIEDLRAPGLGGRISSHMAPNATAPFLGAATNGSFEAESIWFRIVPHRRQAARRHVRALVEQERHDRELPEQRRVGSRTRARRRSRASSSIRS